MAERIATAVLHCALNEPQKIIDLAIRVHEKMYVVGSPYTTPPVTAANLLAQINKANTAQAKVKTGSVQDRIDRDTEVKALFTLLNPTLIEYVNGLFKGNATNLAMSGFDVVESSEPHEVPDTPAIKRIENGPVEHSAKVFLAGGAVPVESKKKPTTYILQLSEDKGETYHTVLTTHNSRELIADGLTRGSEVMIRIAANNTAGTSPYSDPVAFIPD